MARPPGSGPSGPPISYKTVPGRHRTQKWNVAKQYDYSGDDWGGYDAYDDYGETEPPQQPPLPASPSIPQLPSQQQQRSGRQMSFDRTDPATESRQFSAGPVLYAGVNNERSAGVSPARSAVSATSSGGKKSGEFQQPPVASAVRQRDFTDPGQVPAPLSPAARASPALSSSSFTAPATAPAPNNPAAFPPRKSSIGSGSSASDAPPSAAKVEKELPTPPFIRPSDIYRRLAEEREKERQSLEGGRPSLDALQQESEAPADLDPPGRQQRPLSAVEEAAGEGQHEDISASEGFGEPTNTLNSAVLPRFSGVSSFGNDWFVGRNSGSTVRTTASESAPTIHAPDVAQPTSTADIALPIYDPAAEILAERTHETPVSAIGRQNQPDELAHPPSAGYRSAVNNAFTPPTRDNSQSTTGISRSGSESTSGISPIMSHVPFPPIAEAANSNTTVPIVAEHSTNQPSLLRNPTPPHSTTGSAERDAAIAGVGAVAAGAAAAGLVAGHSQSQDTSRFEEPAKTSASQVAAPSTSSALPRTGRARAGTDYSVRESDLADAVNNNDPSDPSSPEMSNRSPVEAAREEQSLFLQTHSLTPSTTPAPAFLESPGSGRASPAKGRVREIADKFQDLHEASRRNSQASLKSASTWSRVGSEENLSAVHSRTAAAPGAGVAPVRQGTGDTWASSHYDAGEDQDTPATPVPTAGGLLAGESSRPAVDREQSFRPQLPGGWVSYQDAPSQAAEDHGETLPATVYAQATPRPPNDGKKAALNEVDLTPTTRKVSLPGTHHQEESSHIDQVRDAGAALGAALVASVGMGHQSHDFGSSEPAQPVDQPEMQYKPSTGDLNQLHVPQRPELTRGDTDATDVTDVVSAQSSVPPTPPAKDPQRHRTAAESGEYFFTVTPLRTTKSREGSPDKTIATPPASSAARSGVSPAMSTWVRPNDTESDRLRKEIVRSLDSASMEQKIEEDTARTQDALDAPANARRVEQGKDALPAAEFGGGRPGMLGKRFNWEKDEDEDANTQDAGLGYITPARPSEDKALPPPPIVREPEPEESPEIKPEMPYERPRSRGLHIVNADSSDEEEQAAVSRRADNERQTQGLWVNTSSAGPVSPLTKSQEDLHFRTIADAARDGEDGPSGPSPDVEEGRERVALPSYYTLDLPGIDGSKPRDTDPAADAPEVKEQRYSQRSIAELPAMQDIPPRPVPKDTSSPSSPTGRAKTPAFREILAIKSSSDRIRTYDETRQTFADTNTGLSDWLSGMLAQHPEHAGLTSANPAQANAISNLKGAHRSSPSLAKFTRQFSTGAGPAGTGDYQGGLDSTGPKTPSKDLDMDELKQKGKDLMKNASVLGGKAQAGAKGLLAKGKSRFGSTRENRSKDFSSNTSAPSATTAIPPIPQRSTARSSVLQPLPPIIDRSEPDTVPSHPTAGITKVATAPAASRSSSPGNPLSRALSRLRERSRSQSSSRSRQSRHSRPSSLVLLNSHEAEGTAAAAAAAAAAMGGGLLEKESRKKDSGATGASAVSPPWSESESGPRTPISAGDGGGAGVAKRLGILPSPTKNDFAAGRREAAQSTIGDSSLALPQRSLLAGSEATPHRLADLNLAAAKFGEGQDDDEDLYSSTPTAVRRPLTGEENSAGDATPRPPQGQWVRKATDSVVEGDGLHIDAPITDTKEYDALKYRVMAGHGAPEEKQDLSHLVPGAWALNTTGTAPAQDEARMSSDTRDVSEADVSSFATAEEHGDDDKSEVSPQVLPQPAAVGEVEGGNDDVLRTSSISSLTDRHPIVVLPPTAVRDVDREEPVAHTLPTSYELIKPDVGTGSEQMGRAAALEKNTPGLMQRSQLTPLEVPRPPLARPLSFEPLDRDYKGAPVPETLHRSPISRGDEDTFTFNTTTLTRHRKVSLPGVDRKSKRLSGFMGSDTDTSAPQTPVDGRLSGGAYDRSIPAVPEVPVAPPAAAYVDPAQARDTTHVPEVPAARPVTERVDVAQDEGKQGRRKSGIWDAFKRSSSIPRSEARRQGTPQQQSARGESTSRGLPPTTTAASRGRLEKPQRASTNLIETEQKHEKKKKRLSGFGALFGRSSTTGHETKSSSNGTKSKASRNEQLAQQVPHRRRSYEAEEDEVEAPTGGWYVPDDDPGRYPPPQQVQQWPPPQAPHVPPTTMYSQNNSQIRPDHDRYWHEPPRPPFQQNQQSHTDQLTPQVSGQSEWLRSGRQQGHGSMPSISPVRTRMSSEGYAAPDTNRFRPIDDVRNNDREMTNAGVGQPQLGSTAGSSVPSDWVQPNQGSEQFSLGDLPRLDTGRPVHEEFENALRESPTMQYGQAMSADVPIYGSNKEPALTSRDDGEGQMPTPDGKVEMKGVSYPGQEWTPTPWE